MTEDDDLDGALEVHSSRTSKLMEIWTTKELSDEYQKYRMHTSSVRTARRRAKRKLSRMALDSRVTDRDYRAEWTQRTAGMADQT
jgi:hypothetical protein